MMNSRARSQSLLGYDSPFAATVSYRGPDQVRYGSIGPAGCHPGQLPPAASPTGDSGACFNADQQQPLLSSPGSVGNTARAVDRTRLRTEQLSCRVTYAERASTYIHRSGPRRGASSPDKQLTHRSVDAKNPNSVHSRGLLPRLRRHFESTEITWAKCASVATSADRTKTCSTAKPDGPSSASNSSNSSCTRSASISSTTSTSNWTGGPGLRIRHDLKPKDGLAISRPWEREWWTTPPSCTSGLQRIACRGQEAGSLRFMWQDLLASGKFKQACKSTAFVHRDCNRLSILTCVLFTDEDCAPRRTTP